MRKVTMLSMALFMAVWNIPALHSQAFPAAASGNLEPGYAVHANVEIFDVKQGSVIRQLESSPDIQREAKKFLEEIDGMYVKVKAFPEEGYIVRIPLEPPANIQNEWLNALVNEVFVIFPGDENAPYLLVLDGKGRPYFYTFHGKVDTLLEKLNFNPVTAQ